jgi:hypothetical protein
MSYNFVSLSRASNLSRDPYLNELIQPKLERVFRLFFSFSYPLLPIGDAKVTKFFYSTIPALNKITTFQQNFRNSLLNKILIIEIFYTN